MDCGIKSGLLSVLALTPSLSVAKGCSRPCCLQGMAGGRGLGRGVGGRGGLGTETEVPVG